MAGTLTDLGTLGVINSSASFINASGQAGGESDLAGDAASHTTLWNGATAIDLNG
jgi:hypothetical protein